MPDILEMARKGIEGLGAKLDEVNRNPEKAAELSKEREGNPITLGPLVPSPTDWVNDMTEAAKAKAAKWLKKSTHPSVDPKVAAKAAAGKYKNNMQLSLDEGRWPKGIDAYDEDVRIKSIEGCGESGFRTGIDRKKHKAQAKIEKLQPLVATLKGELAKMKVDTKDERGAKMLAARDGMLEVGKKMRTV